MRKIAIVAATLALVIAATSAHGAECGLKLIASYDISRDVKGAIVIPLKIAGKTEPVLVDTGAFGNWVTESFVNESKLPQHSIREDMKAYTVRSRITKYVTIPSVDIGPVHVENTDFTVWPDVQKGIAGALGINALQQFDIEFDFAANKMNFFSQDHCEGQVVYWAKSYAVVPFKMASEDIQLTMTLDGHDFDTKMDTGSTYTYVNNRAVLGTFGYDENSPNIKEVTLSDGDKVRTATFNSLSIGGISFPKPSLLVHNDSVRSLAKDDVPVKDQNQAGVTLAHFPHVLLGLDALRQLHLYIAFKEHKIYATAANAH